MCHFTSFNVSLLYQQIQYFFTIVALLKQQAHVTLAQRCNNDNDMLLQQQTHVMIAQRCNTDTDMLLQQYYIMMYQHKIYVNVTNTSKHFNQYSQCEI